MTRKVHIRTKIFFIVLVAVIPTVIVSLYSAFSFKNLYLTRNKTQINTVCSGYVNEQRHIARNAEEMMLAISQTRSVQNKDYDYLTVYLADLMKKYPGYAALLAASEDAVVIASGVHKIGYSLADRPYLQRAMNSRAFTIGHFIVSRSTGIPSVTFTLPVQDRAGDTLYLIATYALDSYLDEMSLAGLPPGLILEVFDVDGKRLFYAGDDEEMPPGEPVCENLYARAKEGPAFSEIVEIDSESWLASISSYSRSGVPVYVAVRASYDDVLYQSYAPVVILLVVMLLSCAGASVISLLMARRLFVGRVEKLTEYTRSLAMGNLSVRSGINTARDEITELVESFNTMAETLEERSAANDQALREKERLLTELQKRVSDNLQLLSSMISLQLDHTENDSARISLLTTHSRVMALAMVYETIYRYSDVQEVYLHRYCKGLCEYLVALYADVGKTILCDVCGVDIALTLDKALPLALIINELVSNSLMHAFPDRTEGSVGIFFERKNDGSILMTVSDNGGGFDWNSSENDSFGFEMMHALVDQLGGTMNVESGSSGTRATIQFPTA